MSYKLEYPYSEIERVDFIGEHNYYRRAIKSIDNFIEERDIIETREVVNEETGEVTYEEVVVGTETVVIGAEIVVTEVEVGTKLVNYPTYYALEPNEIWDEETQQPIIDEDYEAKQAEERKKTFETAFFATSLGWIRRNVSMKDGSTKSFLTDLLPQLVVGIPVLAYALPDFTQEVSIVDYQQKVIVTEQFIQECKNQLYADFYGTNPE